MSGYAHYYISLVKFDSTGHATYEDLPKGYLPLCFDYAVDESGFSVGAVQWPDHEDDMFELAAMHPDDIIALRCEGENQGDMCEKFFNDGSLVVIRYELSPKLPLYPELFGITAGDRPSPVVPGALYSRYDGKMFKVVDVAKEEHSDDYYVIYAPEMGGNKNSLQSRKVF